MFPSVIDENKIPPTWKMFKEKDNILISKNVLENFDKEYLKGKNFLQITNAKPIEGDHFMYTASGDLPVAAGTVDYSTKTTPNWKEWLKANKGSFYSVILEFLSSHFAQWEIYQPQSSPIGGIKTVPKVMVSSGEVVHLYSFGEDIGNAFYPQFKLYNYSQKTLTFATAKIILGMKYSVIPIKDVPDVFTPIIIPDVGTA